MLPPAVGGSKDYLAGEIAGDYGFDPLGLAEDRSALLKYTEYEVSRPSGAFWRVLGNAGGGLQAAQNVNNRAMCAISCCTLAGQCLGRSDV